MLHVARSEATEVLYLSLLQQSFFSRSYPRVNQSLAIYINGMVCWVCFALPEEDRIVDVYQCTGWPEIVWWRSYTSTYIYTYILTFVEDTIQGMMTNFDSNESHINVVPERPMHVPSRVPLPCSSWSSCVVVEHINMYVPGEFCSLSTLRSLQKPVVGLAIDRSIDSYSLLRLFLSPCHQKAGTHGDCGTDRHGQQCMISQRQVPQLTM